VPYRLILKVKDVLCAAERSFHKFTEVAPGGSSEKCAAWLKSVNNGCRSVCRIAVSQNPLNRRLKSVKTCGFQGDLGSKVGII
jgi:hypothetical protein